jgi:hypothetical protein
VIGDGRDTLFMIPEKIQPDGVIFEKINLALLVDYQQIFMSFDRPFFIRYKRKCVQVTCRKVRGRSRNIIVLLRAPNSVPLNRSVVFHRKVEAGFLKSADLHCSSSDDLSLIVEID